MGKKILSNAIDSFLSSAALGD